MVAILAVLIAIYWENGQLEDTYRFWFDALAAMILVASFYTNDITTMFFRCGLSRALGKISFPLYLIQFCVLVSFTSFLIVASGGLTNDRVVVISGASIAMTIVCATVFYMVEARLLDLMDRWVKSLLRRHSRWGPP